MDYDIDMLDCLTISNLAMKLFMTKYYNNISNINKLSLYNDVKLAYYRGITEVYKPRGINLYYYDVNSLYTYVKKYILSYFWLVLKLSKLNNIKSNKLLSFNKIYGIKIYEIKPIKIYKA